MYLPPTPPSSPPSNVGHNPVLQHQWTPNCKELITNLTEKISPYCTKDFINTKAKDLVIAKVAPLSTPNDLARALKKAKSHRSYLTSMHRAFSRDLKVVKDKIAHLENKEQPPTAKLNTLKESKVHLEERLEGLKSAINKTSQYIEHLKIKKKAILAGRMTGYLGTAADMVVPGSGAGVKLALTTTITAMPEVSAAKLTHAQEKRSVHWSTAFTAMSFIASTAVSYYIWPAVNQLAAGYFTPSQNNTQS